LINWKFHAEKDFWQLGVTNFKQQQSLLHDFSAFSLFQSVKPRKLKYKTFVSVCNKHNIVAWTHEIQDETEELALVLYGSLITKK
jgi:hypothetical protein